MASDSEDEEDEPKNNDKKDEEKKEEDNDEQCGICMTEIPEDDIGVTKCGHIFCYECLKTSVSKMKSCPYCKSKLKDTDVYIMSYERPKIINNAEEKKKQDLINEVGTKLANLIFYLRSINDHVIIFSQWDDLLRRIGRILEENNIKNVFCKGNCYQRDKFCRLLAAGILVYNILKGLHFNFLILYYKSIKTST